MWRLSPAKAESGREFWPICEVLQAMKQAEYPRPLWFLSRSVEEPTASWQKFRNALLEHAEACDQGFQSMRLKLLGQTLLFGRRPAFRKRCEEFLPKRTEP